ncbi:lipopolysaccharide biosynthesis protein [Photorhabdus heterorhabditis]|uniref:Lipopolysaccharide biosynthesis protein n=1 Tax=Photorhabdus heterorhabditis TaxID=880156 RepID=A0ABR5KDC7_9GAMM|nr:O-antigen translocase [Photorhabdus heterorhabditis]KOY62598.1 lipopolysaccharide biosynthesis protein [Photorhabdus heterorhabditis]
MTLFKTSILSLIATAFKMLAGLVINKAVSLYIGPAGLALIGQFQSLSQLIMIAAQGAINNGVVKYTAEYGPNDSKTPALFSTAAKISLITSIIVGILLILLSQTAAKEILLDIKYQYVFIIFGFTIVLFVLNGLLLSILNGLKEIQTYIKINIIQSIYALVLTSILIIAFKLNGALIALATHQSIILLVTLFLLRKHPIIKWENFIKPFNRPIAKKLMGYSAMAITSAIMVPVSHLIIRNYLGTTLGWDQAGYWQGIWYISTMYLMVVTTALSTYYLPRLSEITNNKELKKEITQGYRLIIPIVTICALLIYLFRDIIITILFTQNFTPMRDLFLWQVIGDVFKIASWLLAYLMLAKAMVKSFIITEIIFGISFILLSYSFVNNYGLIGMGYAYCLNYVLYLITMLIFFKKLG